MAAPIRVPDNLEGADPAEGPDRKEEEGLPPNEPSEYPTQQEPAPGDERAGGEYAETGPGGPGGPEGDGDGEGGDGDGAGGDTPEGEPLRTRVSPWSSIGADTSDVVRPEPKDVDLKTPILLFLAPVVILLVGSFVARELVWERFLDPYVWQMIVHDEGFNPVNTGLWALLLGLLLFVAYRLVQKLEQPVDFLMVAATVPYMVGGAIVRVMEDTGYFGDPLRFFFITPIIYVLIFGVAVLWLVMGWVLRQQAQKVGPEAALRSLAGLFGVIWVLYFAWSHFGDVEIVSQVASPWVLLFAFLVPLVYFWVHTRQNGSFSQVGAMAAFGTAFMLFALYMLVMWHAGAQWDAIVQKPLPAQPENNLWVYPLMLGLAGVFIGVIYWIAFRSLGKHENAFVFLLPINLVVIFGQTWDSLSTSIGIDFLGYTEKHWLPGILIDALKSSGLPVLTDYAASFVMIPLKILVAFAVVYLVDIYSRSDMVRYPDLVGLVKLAIIMVGIVPGTRNGIRMAMGV